MANIILTPVVTDVLNRSTMTANSLKLPEQLDRPVYMEVNKVIVMAGGKWNRSAGCHVFDGDPRVKLGLALETGKVIDEKKQYQSFFTPSAVAARVVELAEVSGQTVLEPSAGDGALADECMVQGAKNVHCVELNHECVVRLCEKKYTTIEGDFLTQKPRLYPRIVMNPPFTKNQDIKHVEHALRFLAPDGILVAVMSPNTTRPKFKAMLEGRDYDIEEVEAGAFKESGTSISTIILRVRG